jgi:hypothetical protein
MAAYQSSAMALGYFFPLLGAGRFSDFPILKSSQWSEFILVLETWYCVMQNLISPFP